MNHSGKELTARLEEKFGRLTPAAEHHAQEFHNYYELYVNAIKSGSVFLIPSYSQLAKTMPEGKYRIYRTFEGLFILTLMCGLTAFVFNWIAGVSLITLSLLLTLTSQYYKRNMSMRFALELTVRFFNDPDDGMLELCRHYIDGVVALESKEGRAIAPLLPTFCLTGIKEYARNEYLQEEETETRKAREQVLVTADTQHFYTERK